MFRGLRWRLLLSYLTVMAAILGIFGAGVYVFFSQSMYSQLDKKLRTLAQAATPSFTQVKSRGSNYVNQVDIVPWRDIFNRDSQSLEWFDNRGKLLARRGTINLESSLELGFWTFPDPETNIPVRTLTISVFTDSSLDRPEGYIRASQSLEEIYTIKSQLFWVLIFGGMSTLILIGLGGFWLTRKAIEPIEASFNKLKQFTADASHELRGPVTAIKASVDVMQCHPERIHPKDAKKLSAISSATTQMGQLIGDLLFLARTDNATDVPARKRTKIALNKVLQDLVVLLEPIAQEKNITLKYELRPDIYIFGDLSQLNRLFSNLIENALQYTPSGGKVNVSLSKQNRFSLVNVEDSGIGIAPEQIPFVFDRFWRADKARTRREGGTGLGLAIASAIAQSHGGKITVTSQINKGSCFQVRIPVLAQKADI
ncbi:MAG: ATP-binding protein [Xenococcaceae cyanobacterium MO_188.B29]|nr:ATP-binding protein [Xenococcaceae cyanobacterium MO_188.B29]